MSRGKIIVMSGPSGAGKTTLYKKLLKDPDFKRSIQRSISATTRAPRAGEKNGQDYRFLTQRMFEYKIKANHFLEWQKVFDHYYGTPKKNVKDLLKAGRNVLLCIDVKGAKEVIRQNPQTLTIFVKTASTEVLKKRLQERASETDGSLALRLKTAEKELQEEKHYKNVVINDELETAYKRLKSILKQELKA